MQPLRGYVDYIRLFTLIPEKLLWLKCRRGQSQFQSREALLSEAGFEKVFRTQNWVRRSVWYLDCLPLKEDLSAFCSPYWRCVVAWAVFVWFLLCLFAVLAFLLFCLCFPLEECRGTCPNLRNLRIRFGWNNSAENFCYSRLKEEKSGCQGATFESVNKKQYRFCFLPWKSCTFAPSKIWQRTGKCFEETLLLTGLQSKFFSVIVQLGVCADAGDPLLGCTLQHAFAHCDPY